jgi:hypothetical protein
MQLSFRNSFVWDNKPICRDCLRELESNLLSEGKKLEQNSDRDESAKTERMDITTKPSVNRAGMLILLFGAIMGVVSFNLSNKPYEKVITKSGIKYINNAKEYEDLLEIFKYTDKPHLYEEGIKSLRKRQLRDMILWTITLCSLAIGVFFIWQQRKNAPYEDAMSEFGNEKVLAGNVVKTVDDDLKLLPDEIQCPDCGADLKLNDIERKERKFTCFECKETFVVKN